MKEAIIRGALGRETSEHIIQRPDGSVLRHAAVPLPDGAMLHSYLDMTKMPGLSADGSDVS